MPRTGFDWHLRDKPVGSEEMAAGMKPWIQYCIEQFGPERSMFESNFPVDKVSSSYNVLYNAFKRLSTGYSPSERDAFTEIRKKGVVIAQVFPSGEHVAEPQGGGQGPRPAGTASQPPLPPTLAVQHLTPQKVRILLMLALTKTKDPREIQKLFDEY